MQIPACLALCLAVLAILPFAGCYMTYIEGSGVPASETRTVADFDSISLAGSGKVEIIQGEETSLTIEADDNILPLIKTEVKGRNLEISQETDFRTSIRYKTDLKVTVTTKDLKSISVAGSGDIIARDFKTKDFSIAIAGSGDVLLTGEAESLDVSIAGSGDCQLEGFKVDRCEISIAGSGSAVVAPEKELEVSIAGSGDVVYHGEPEITQSIMGSGSIRPAK